MKLIFWLLNPILDNQHTPSIKRLMALAFLFGFIRNAEVNYYAGRDISESNILAFGGIICAMLGITSWQSIKEKINA